MPKREKAEVASSFEQYLRGYACQHPHNLGHVQHYTGWRQRAAAEMDTRAARFLAALDNDTLAAIASGEIDVQGVAESMRKTENGEE